MASSLARHVSQQPHHHALHRHRLLYHQQRQHDHLRKEGSPQNLSNSSGHPSPWTDVSTLCNQGQLDNALLVLLPHMDTVAPAHVYVSLLKACGRVKNLHCARKIHSHLAQHNLDTTVQLGEPLLVAFAKCGALDEAHSLLVSLPHRTVLSWTAMIASHTDRGNGLEALRLQYCMVKDGVEPDQYTYVCLLRACAIEQDLQRAEKLHTNAERRGFTSNVFIGSTLISVYGKLGNISEAEVVFVRLSQRNLVSWNAMLTAYIEQGKGEKALRLYRQMQEEEVGTTGQTFLIIIQACGILVQKQGTLDLESQAFKEISLNIGKALHIDTWRKGLSSDLFVGNTLISMYGKCGNVIEAEIVFSKLYEHNLISWNAMLSAYVDQSQGEKALQLYRQMLEEGVDSDHRTFVITLQACGDLIEEEKGGVEGEQSTELMCLDIVNALHGKVRRQGFVSDVFVCSSLGTVYSKCGDIAKAESVFDALPEPNIVSWNAMLSAYFEQRQARKALQFYKQMQEEGMPPSPETFLIILQACGALAEKVEVVRLEGQSAKVTALEIGKALHDDVHRKGYTLNAFVASTLVSLYGKCGSIEDAENVFDRLVGHDVVSWTAMLSAYAEQGEGAKAFHLYGKMQEACILLNDVTMISVMQACCETGNLEICVQLHFISIVAGYDTISLLANTLIRAYGSCSCMADAQAVLDGVCQPDAASWSSYIAGYAQEGNTAASLQVFMEMQTVGALPDEVTFFAVLSACNHASLTYQGSEYFESMGRCYGVNANLKHYAIIIDLFGRVGAFEIVENLVMGMPMQADSSVWLCLLGACRSHGNVEIGKLAFDNAVSLDPKDVSLYVFLSNIYADAGMHELAYEVDSLGAIHSLC